MYKTFLLVALCALWGSMSAQIPTDYYDAASGLNGTALKSALHDIIDDHNEINYDAVKGDVARAIFYMCTRYEGDVVDEPNLEILDLVTESSTGGFGYLGVLIALLELNVSDPVDDAEIARNNAIYTSYQNNRNPYIDHPEYVDLI